MNRLHQQPLFTILCNCGRFPMKSGILNLFQRNRRSLRSSAFITSLTAPSSRRFIFARTWVMYLLCCLFDCQCADEGGKFVLLINTDKKGKKQAHQTKLYQKYFPSCFKPRRILSRTRLGSTPSTPAISFTVIPR